MNKIILSLILVSSITIVEAQSTEDALRYSMNRNSGTARNISLGGAMGALGGDFSGISTNPGGIAVYRSSEFTFTPSLHYSQTEANFYGTTSSDNKFNVPFQQIGFVGTYKPIREASSGLISTHFGIGYNRTNSYSRNTFIQATGLLSSLLDEYVDQANQGNWNDFYNGMAYDNYLLRNNPFEESEKKYLNDFQYVAEDPNTPNFGADQGLNHSRLISEKGNSGEFNLSLGANFNHNLYLGASMGISSQNYEKGITHFEEVNGGWESLTDAYIYYRALDGWEAREDFTFTESVSTSGLGINLKVGAIYKPTTSLRIGAAVHTPTFYSFDEEYNTSIESNYIDLGLDEINDEALIYDTGGTDQDQLFGEFSYNFRSPFKAIGSLAYTFKNYGLISMDYEYLDYSSMQYYSSTSSITEMQDINNKNNLIKSIFRATHNFKFGAEFKPTEVFTLRAGYSTNQSPYKEGHFKNNDKYQTFSGGIGYRMNDMFIDFGYMLRHEQYGYSLYTVAPNMPGGELETAEIDSKQHQLAVTLGWRF